MIGRTIGKYRIVEQIGRGGMGTVYKAIDETLDRQVAIKLLNADLIDQDAVERFRREAVTLAKLSHGRIGSIHELTRDGHDLLMVMEYLEGETFEKLIERGPMPVPRAVTLTTQVLDALQYAHAAGVIHRDLKPANVMLTPSGEVKVMDFGIARVQGSEHLTTNGFMVGTPAYMAPEQVRGEEVDPRMDLYAIAVVLYRMVTAKLPFQGDTAIAMIHSQLNNPPTPPRQFRADLPDWLVQVIERGLAKKPADRFQTAAEFKTALENGLTGKMPIVTAAMEDPEQTLAPMLTPPPARVPAAASAVAPSPSVIASGVAASPAVIASGVSRSAMAPPVITPPETPGPLSQAPMPMPKNEATVTLRAPHLATAGILLALLVAGVAVLAFIALRRPATIITQNSPASSESAAAGSTPSDVAPAATDTAPAATPPAAPSAAATPATPAAPGAAASAAKPVTPATTSGAPSVTTPAATGAARGAATPAAPGPTGAATTTARGVTPPVTAPASAAAPAPVAPAAAAAPTENFGDVKTLVVDGTRSREVDALLSLEPGNLVVRSRADGAVLKTLPYTSIAAATYARARRPRGQTAPGAMDVPENVGGSGFLGGARHWLTLQTQSEFVIIRLEDRNIVRVLNALEARTGSKIVRNVGD